MNQVVDDHLGLLCALDSGHSGSELAQYLITYNKLSSTRHI